MKSFTNPIIPTMGNDHTADPYVLFYENMYYHCYLLTDGEKSGIYLAKAGELCDLAKVPQHRVFAVPESGKGSKWYAPELHRLNDAWYIYASPATDEKNEEHTMMVLERRAEDPIGEYTNLGMIRGLENEWSIDGTVFEYGGKNWFIWTRCAEMYLAEMDSPTSICGKILSLAHPEYEFETRQGCVNEGPAVLKHDGRLYVVYSANDSRTDDYCLGLLTFSGGDILDGRNWYKHKTAVFEKTEDIFWPGHCSFTRGWENGRAVDYIVYHANLESGSGWKGRSVWAQSFTWENGLPCFGKPHR